MKINLNVTNSKRIIAVLLVALLALSAFNTYMIFQKPSPNSAVTYAFVVSKQGSSYQLKNVLAGSVVSVSSASSAINSALTLGKSVYLNSGTYSLDGDILVSNKVNAKIVGDDATIVGNGYKIVVSGDNYTDSQYAAISGLTLIDATIRVENSFGTTISNMNFENTSCGIEVANTNSWSENTLIEDCHFINATEGIAFRTPAANGTGSYSSSEINRCFFNLRDNSVGIVVERKAEFSDCQMQNVRMWTGQDGVTNQTGLLDDGSMYQTLLFGVVFESFTNEPNDMFAIDLGVDCNPAPILEGGVSFLGNWTANIHNPFGIWVSGVGSAFERVNVNIPVGVGSQYGDNWSVQVQPLRIFSFNTKIEVANVAPNEIVTVRIRLSLADNVVSNSVTKTFTNATAVWLSNDDMLQLYPSQDIIWAVLIDAKSNLASSSASVTISSFGTAG